MTRKNPTEKAIEIANSDPKVIEAEIEKATAALAERYHNLGIAIAYTIDDGQGAGLVGQGAGLVGNFSPHQMLHAIDNLMMHAIEAAKKLDPEGTESFFEELKIRQGLKQFAEWLGGKIGEQE